MPKRLTHVMQLSHDKPKASNNKNAHTRYYIHTDVSCLFYYSYLPNVQTATLYNQSCYLYKQQP